jgi:hypothetical protein
MSNNPYAPPNAPVADVGARSTDNSNPLFAVGLVKLFVMCLVTFGIYEFYWFYKHWQRIRARDGSDIMPFWRAWFAIFFCYSLFKRMRADGEDLKVASSFAAGPLAALFIIGNLVWRLPDPFWLITFVSIGALFMAQKYANEVNATATPDHDRNEEFRGWNWVGVVCGGVFWVLVLIGLFIPVEI